MKTGAFSELIFFHYIMDFVLQSDRIATGKRKSAAVRLQHVVIYHTLFVVWLMVRVWRGQVSMGRAMIFLALSFVSHYLIDSRVWGKSSCWNQKAMIEDQGAHAVILWLGAHILQI